MTRTKCPFGLQVVGRVVGQDRRVIDVVNHFTASCMECNEASMRACEQEGGRERGREGEQEAGWSVYLKTIILNLVTVPLGR